MMPIIKVFYPFFSIELNRTRRYLLGEVELEVRQVKQAEGFGDAFRPELRKKEEILKRQFAMRA